MDIEDAVLFLTGTIGNSIEKLAEDAGVSVDELMKAAAEQGVTECSECGWWMDTEETEDGEFLCWQCNQD